MRERTRRGTGKCLASVGLAGVLLLASAGRAEAAGEVGEPASGLAKPVGPPARAEGSGQFDVVPFALPAYQPESSLMVAGAAVLAYQPPKGSGLKESSLMLAGAASLRRQYSLLLQPEWYFAHDALQLNALAGVERFPDLFYGVGNATRTRDEERYTPEYFEFMVNPCWRVLPSLFVGPLFRVQGARLRTVAPGGMLAARAVPGAEGGTTVQVGASASWDTRDNTLNPRAGTLVRLSLQAAPEALGSTFDFTVAKLDARLYRMLPWLGHVLAAQAVVELRSGEAPFYDLGRLGGPSSMRGYYAGRYRDRQLATAQLEYRAPLFWRIGMVGFAAAGNVARDVSGLADAVKLASGVGVRWAPLADVPVNIRADFAYGSDLYFYLRMAEAF